MDTTTWLLERSAIPRHAPRRLSSSRRAAARTVALRDGQAWSTVSSRAGLALRCTKGKLWVTFEGDPEDHIVAAPEVFTAPERGRVAVMALGPATIEVVGAGHLRS